jgi:hypothetical protein
MIESGESKYIIPSVDGTPIVLDIAAVVKAESRLHEVAQTNTHNAPELLSTYNEHWLTLHKCVSVVTHERNKADEALKVTIAEATLDCNDEFLKKKGHNKSSQDLREAMVTIDPKVRLAKERLNEIKAILEYLNGKKQAFENAYTSVKKLISSMQPPPERLHGQKSEPTFETRPRSTDVTNTSSKGYKLPEGFDDYSPRKY